MPSEKVLNLPLSGDEIIEIMLQRIEARLRSDCFLSSANTYNGFSYELDCKIKFKDMMLGRETLVWDRHAAGETLEKEQPVIVAEKFDSGDSPNAARQDADLEIPVQTQEGKRTVIRKRKFPKAGVSA